MPSDVFTIIGDVLASRSKTPAENRFSEQFIHWRTEAERRARLVSTRDEVTLTEIWDHLRKMLPANIAADDGETLELKFEREAIYPNEELLRRINENRNNGLRIIFISDTYLPGDFIESCLKEYGMMKPGDGLYTSSSYGIQKRDGKLFSLVLGKENCHPSEILHTGDNLESDVKAPERVGIRAELFRPKRQVHASPGGTIPDSISIRAETTRHPGSVGKIANLAPAPCDLVSRFLGPFCCIFAHWILRNARRDEIARLFFAARDCRLLWDVCRQLESKEKHPINCEYLYISRRALLLASIDTVSRDSLKWVQRDFERPTLDEIAVKLGLDSLELRNAWRKLYPHWTPHHQLISNQDWNCLWQLILNPPFCDLIATESRIRQERLLAYLNRVRFYEPDRCALVDLGWHLTAQCALNNIRRLKGVSTISGYYFLLKRNRLGPGEAGSAKAVLFEPAADQPLNPVVSQIDFRETLLEHVVGLADHPSVAGYSQDGTVILGTSDLGPNYCHSFHKIQSQLIKYTAENGDKWRDIAENEDCATALANLVAAFFGRPDPKAYYLIQNIPVSMSHPDSGAQPLVLPHSFGETIQRFIPSLWVKHTSARDVPRLWPEAAWSETSPTNRLLMRCFWLMRRIATRLHLG